jgi:hypothetical protein
MKQQKAVLLVFRIVRGIHATAGRRNPGVTKYQRKRYVAFMRSSLGSFAREKDTIPLLKKARIFGL